MVAYVKLFKYLHWSVKELVTNKVAKYTVSLLSNKLEGTFYFVIRIQCWLLSPSCSICLAYKMKAFVGNQKVFMLIFII